MRIIRGWAVTILEVEVHADEGTEAKAIEQAIARAARVVEDVGCLSGPIEGRHVDQGLLTKGVSWEEVERS
jgi:hypothetical protein